jgi:hypothetical protein
MPTGVKSSFRSKARPSLSFTVAMVKASMRAHRFNVLRSKRRRSTYGRHGRGGSTNEFRLRPYLLPTHQRCCLYRVTNKGGVTATYLQDGKRVRTNDTIQEFESEGDAEFTLKRMIRPAKGTTITEEQVGRDVAGLSELPLTDMFL